MANKPGMNFRDRVKQKAKESEFSGGSDTLNLRDGVSFFKPKKGKNEIVILPFIMSNKNLEDIAPGEYWYRYQILKHFRIGAQEKAFICPRTIGKPCPICEYSKKLLDSGRDRTDPEVASLAAKKRDLYEIIDMEDGKFKVWEMSYHLFGRQLEEEIREAPDSSIAAQFADPDEGAILSVRMVEDSMGSNKFLATSRIDFIERDPIEDDLLEQVFPLDKAVVIHSYDKLNKIFYDMDDDDTDTAETDADAGASTAQAPRTRQSAKTAPAEAAASPEARSRRPVPAPVEEDNEEVPAAPPASKPRGTQPKAAEPAPRQPRRTVPAATSVEEDDTPPPPVRSTPSKAAPAPEFTCSHGGVFGETCDIADLAKLCDRCPIWNECRDATDEFEKNLPF